MDLSVITVVSLLMMFCGRIAAKENEVDLGLDPSVYNVFTRYGSDHCCSRIDNQRTILKGISYATEKLTKDVGEIKTGVEDDIPSELKRQAVDQERFSSKFKSEFKRQAEDLEDLSSELKGVKASVSDMSISLNRHSKDLLVHDARMQEQGLVLEKINNLVTDIHGSLTGPKDCSDIKALGHSKSGVYRVYPGSLDKRLIPADVYCDMTTPGGNWMVFQRRKDGYLNFKRTWIEYVTGFGDPSGEVWLGNELLYLLTSNAKYKLRIDMEDFEGQKRYAEYSTFSVGSSADNYRLKVSGYSGNAGDSFSSHNGMQFSTKDVDNDIDKVRSCSVLFHGGWWYTNCHASNLNGLYLGGPHTSHADGIEWSAFRGYNYSLKKTEMKISVAK